MKKIGIIGCGHWGPNHIRNFSVLPGAKIVACCDTDKKRLEHIKAVYPWMQVSVDYQDLLNDKSIDALIVATPTHTHYKLTRESLLAGKDVLCEKPLALSAIEARHLVKIARSKKRILMVGHVFLFNSGIQKIKEYIKHKVLGRVYYLRSTRTNLGPIRSDVNVVMDLAVHDISIFSYILDSHPIKVSATGVKILRNQLEDIAFISLYYPHNILANMHVSWMDPRKVREITIVGDKKMATWDDLNTTDMVRLYDKGITREPFYNDFGEFQLLLREGDVTVPKISAIEPLKAQSMHFIESIQSRRQPLCDGNNGLATLRVLEAIQESLKKDGKAVEVK